MERTKKDLIIREIPLFANLADYQISSIAQRCEIAEYKKGQLIYGEGSPADAFYCVVVGRVLVYTFDKKGNEKVLEYLHRGKYFGMISLLTGEPHSVSARAVNDSVLLVIRKNNFDFILKNTSQLAIDLSQTLSRRLKNKDLHPKSIFESTVISVFSSYAQAGKTVYALNLGLSLKKETHKSVVLLEICPLDKSHYLPGMLGITGDYPLMGSRICGPAQEYILKSRMGIDLVCFKYDLDDQSSVKNLVAALTMLVNDYHYIILDLPSLMDEFVFKALNQSDMIHLLTSPDQIDLKRTRHLIGKLKSEFYFQESKIKVIVNEHKLAKLNPVAEREILGSGIFATLPKIEHASSDLMVLDSPDSEYSMAVRRISRNVGDCLVGLALGVGVGYGFCHIGVLKVIEEENIPIDVISGASIGSVIASLWATGRSAKEILEITREFKEQKYVWRLVDLTIPILGFIKGNRLHKFLKKYLGNKTFQDVKLPLKIIASDIRKKEARVFDKGLLVDAIMASCAMPGVFKPFRFKEEILFDGGVISPLPTEALFKMGVKKIIAVNVTPSREDIIHQYEVIKNQLVATKEAIKKKRWFSLKQYFQEKFKNNIVDVIFSSIEVMQSELVQKEGELADIVLHPDMQGLHWLDLHRAEEFARRGEQEARKNLPRIWDIINE